MSSNCTFKKSIVTEICQTSRVPLDLYQVYDAAFLLMLPFNILPFIMLPFSTPSGGWGAQQSQKIDDVFYE